MFKYYALLALLATSVVASPIPAGSGATNVAARDASGGAVPNPWFNGHAANRHPSAAKRSRAPNARRRYPIEARGQRGHAARGDDDGGDDDQEWPEDRNDEEDGGDKDAKSGDDKSGDDKDNKSGDDKDAKSGDDKDAKSGDDKGDAKGDNKGDDKKNDPPKDDGSKDDSSKNDDDSQGGKSGGGGGGSSGGATTAEATYYNLDDPEQNEGYPPGTVACPGGTYKDSDKIVAVGKSLFGNGDLCGKKVKITDKTNGKSAEATIVDQCGSCDGDKSNNLDLSPSLWADLHGQDASKGANNDGVFAIEYTIMG